MEKAKKFEVEDPTLLPAIKYVGTRNIKTRFIVCGEKVVLNCGEERYLSLERKTFLHGSGYTYLIACGENDVHTCEKSHT